MPNILRKRGVALAVAPDDPVTAWLSLPRRIYLDTSTLQKLFDYGDVIFEGEPFQPVGRAARVKGLSDELGALRMIFLVNERAMFEFVVTEASLREVERRDEPRYTQWVYAVLDTWLIQSASEEPPAPGATFEDGRFGMISVKDRRLLQEALDWGCDAFLTMERRLPTAAAFIEHETGLWVMRPTTYLGLVGSLGQPLLLNDTAGLRAEPRVRHLGSAAPGALAFEFHPVGVSGFEPVASAVTLV